MINKKLLKPINKSGYGEIVGTTTHDTLLNRDKAEQHPISAITNLETTLDSKANETEITAIDAKLVINTNNITKNADDILLKADKTEITALDTKLTLNTNDISDNTAGILLKADKTELVNKQDKLTAGTNISIVGDVISSTGAAAGVTLDTAQTITGIKTFENGIKNNLIEINGNPLIMKNSTGTGSAYFKIEQVYNSGYKNWFGLNFIRTESGTQILTSVIEVRQDNSLYIVSTTDLLFSANNIKFGNARLQGVRTPAADDDAATKKYVDDAVAAALKPYLIDLQKRKES